MLELSHFLGEEHRDLAILGEGNTSAKIDDETFLVKASGSCLETLGEDDVVACRFDALLPMLDQDDLSDQEIEDRLLACRVDSSAKKPSVETLFHAYLLVVAGHRVRRPHAQHRRESNSLFAARREVRDQSTVSLTKSCVAVHDRSSFPTSIRDSRCRK